MQCPVRDDYAPDIIFLPKGEWAVFLTLIILQLQD
jgi:hypothetical protein